jgi:hypothetical protein
MSDRWLGLRMSDEQQHDDWLSNHIDNCICRGVIQYIDNCWLIVDFNEYINGDNK